MTQHPLSAAERARTQAHLAECAQCQDQASELWQVVDSLEALPDALRALPAGRGTWPAVWARVTASGFGLRRHRPAQLSVYLSLVTVFLVAVTALPGGAARRAAAVTANSAHAPEQASVGTVAFGATARPPGDATHTAANFERLAVGAVPVPTPAPVHGG